MALSRKQQALLIPGDVVTLCGLHSADPETIDTVTITNVIPRDREYYANGKPLSPLIQWMPREHVASDWNDHGDGERVPHAQADASFVGSVVQRAPRWATPLPPTNVFARLDEKGQPLFGSQWTYYHRQGNHVAMDLYYGATTILSTVPGRRIGFINAVKLAAAWAQAGRPGARGAYMLMTGQIRCSTECLTNWQPGETRNLSEAACWWIHLPTFRRWLLRNLGRLSLNKAELRADGIAAAKEEESLYNKDLDAYYEREDAEYLAPWDTHPDTGLGLTNDDGSDYEGPDWGVEDPDTYEDDTAYCALCENTNGHSLSCPSISKRNVIDHEGVRTLGDILEEALKRKEETDGEAR